MKRYETHSSAETEQVAEKLGRTLHPGDVVAYTGGMGMGKTAFTRGLARGMGLDAHVYSPTFALVNEYAGDPALYHFDMYRVTSLDDLYSTGFFDYLESGGVLAIEWSENIADALPEGTIYVSIERGDGEDDRIITIDRGDAQ